MSQETYEDDCPGCRPVLINPSTGVVFGPESREQKIIDQLWEGTSPPERIAWHAVCCKNSREVTDLTLAQGFAKRIEDALKKAADA